MSRRLAWRRLRATALAIVFVSPLLAAMAYAVSSSQASARAQVAGGFRREGATSATFVSVWVTQRVALLEADAARYLSSRVVSAHVLALAGGILGLKFAVVLGSDGSILATTPGFPSRLALARESGSGAVRSALLGAVGFSDVADVPGPARIAVAVPFGTSRSRRVLAGLLPLAPTPLSLFLQEMSARDDSTLLMVDRAGHVVLTGFDAGRSSDAGATATMARQIARSPIGTLLTDRGISSYVTDQIAGTPWTLVTVEPTAVLYAQTDGWVEVVPWIVFGFVAMFGVILAAVLVRSIEERRRLADRAGRLEQTAFTDPLTGLPNRRAVGDALRSLVAGQRDGEPMLSLLVIDLDDFKAVNDVYGHPAGDDVLVAIADCMRSVFRKGDVFGRWGGDEFVAALPNTQPAVARRIADRLQAATRAIEISTDAGPVRTGVSIGCVTVDSSVDDALVAADRLLYEQKRTRGARPGELTADRRSS